MPSDQATRNISSDSRLETVFGQMFRGFRFGICDRAAHFEQALEVRRKVYSDECGYSIPIPDEYDHRSWLLFAEHTKTREVVGSMRMTPRRAGLLEAEEYFVLPETIQLGNTVEFTRFAIVPQIRGRTRAMLPVVAFGLFKLAVRLVQRLGVQYVVVCSRPERSFTYQWLNLQRTGRVARYAKLDNREHELLVCKVRTGGIYSYSEHRHSRLFLDIEHPEIRLPSDVPCLGLAPQIEAPAGDPVPRFARSA